MKIISVYILAFLRNFACMLPHLLCVTILLTTIYLQDPIHGNQSSESIDISCQLFGRDKKKEITGLFKMDFMFTKQCHFDDIKA